MKLRKNLVLIAVLSVAVLMLTCVGIVAAVALGHEEAIPPMVALAGPVLGGFAVVMKDLLKPEPDDPPPDPIVEAQAQTAELAKAVIDKLPDYEVAAPATGRTGVGGGA